MGRFESVLELLFSSSFVSQPLRKGMDKFEIAVVVFFFQFFCVTTLEKGNGEI